MSAFRQRLFRQNSLNQDSPKFFLAKVSSFTVCTYLFLIFEDLMVTLKILKLQTVCAKLRLGFIIDGFSQNITKCRLVRLSLNHNYL